MGKPRLTTSLTAASLAGLLILADTSGAAVSYRTVVFTGDAAPDIGPGVVFSFFGSPSLNAAGQTAFWGAFTGSGVEVFNDTGIWSEGSGSLALVARERGAAPGTGPGVVFGGNRFQSDFSNPVLISDPMLNSAGQTAFLGNLIGVGVDATNDRGIWSEGSGSLALVAREGDAAPGTGAGVNFNFLGDPEFSGEGRTAFAASLTGSGVDLTNNIGIWSGGTGALGLVARTGDAAPGTGAGVVYSSFSDPVLNEAGQTAFHGFLTGPGVDGTNNTGIWSEGGRSLALVTRAGDAAPGTGPGVVFGDLGSSLFSPFGFPVLNDVGQVAFGGFLTGPGVDGTNNGGIWSGGGGTLGLVARTGGAAPGTGAGVVYSGFFIFDLVLNGAGQIAFFGGLTGAGVDATNNGGIWSEGGGTLALVARTGDLAPGAGPGVVFSNFSFNPVLNAAGQTAFRGSLTGAGVDETNDEGIWATDPVGVLTLIAREGDLFDVNDDPLIDDLRTIFSVGLLTGSGGEGRASNFNDAGELAFSLQFTDGTSGVFVANTRLPGDLDGDGFVGISDLNLVLAAWNQNVTPWDFSSGDASGDGFVGIEDLNFVLGNWNAGTPPAEDANIPEPASLGMFMLGSLAVAHRLARAQGL